MLRAGVCVLPVDAIAAQAGVERTTVQNALRQGRLLGLILVKEPRIPGRPSLPNVVSIVSKDWIGWLKLGGGVGVRSATPTGSQSSIRGGKRKFRASNDPPQQRSAQGNDRLRL
jgi:hypothetical protein